jgi:hypothetical protein
MAIEWKQGEWRNETFVNNRLPPIGGPMLQVTPQLLRNLNPNTPIDPDGYIAYWMVDNFPWKPVKCEVVVHTKKYVRYYDLEMIPLRDLKWNGDSNVERAIARLFPEAVQVTVWWRSWFMDRTPSTVEYSRRCKASHLIGEV